MSGFSPAMMQSLMTANTALSSAQTSQKAISHMDSRKQILETEIRSGHGDIEGKQAEIERIDAQRAKTAEMQHSALNEASGQLGNTIAEEKDNPSVKDDEKKSAASDKAKDKAEELRDRLQDTEVAAVDYKRGMHIEADRKTSVAVSPSYLEKIAEDPEGEAALKENIGKMQTLEKAQDEPLITRQSWSVSQDGSVTRHVSVGDSTSREDMSALYERLQTAGNSAFGDPYRTAVTRESVQSAAPSQQGLLIDTSL